MFVFVFVVGSSFWLWNRPKGLNVMMLYQPVFVLSASYMMSCVLSLPLCLLLHLFCHLVRQLHYRLVPLPHVLSHLFCSPVRLAPLLFLLVVSLILMFLLVAQVMFVIALIFSLSSPPFMLPVNSAAPVAVSSSSVAVSPSSVAVSSSPVIPSSVDSVESSSAVASSSPVCSVPVTPVLPSRSVSSVPPRVRPAPVWSRPVLPSRPIRYAAPPPRPSPCPSLLPLPFPYCLLLRLVSSCRFCCVSLGHCCCFGLGLFCCMLVANLFL